MGLLQQTLSQLWPGATERIKDLKVANNTVESGGGLGFKIAMIQNGVFLQDVIYG